MTWVGDAPGPLAGGQTVTNSPCAFFGHKKGVILLMLITAPLACDAVTAEECP